MEDLKARLKQAVEASDNGDKDEAIEIYEELLSKKEDWSKPHYNLGLIYKYRNEWDKSYHHNKRAVELNPKDEASQWNLGIAATMLKDWKLARRCWNFFKEEYKIVDEDTAGNVGETPIRLNSGDVVGEVVWATRICPARARINNIPYPESGHRYKDIVLNDGAPNGFRMRDGKEYAVLDEIQHLIRSDYQTFSIKCKPLGNVHFEDLQRRCLQSDIAIENWTTSVRMICKQCSEGKPHETHDHELEETSNENMIAFASTSLETLKEILESWVNETGNDYYESQRYT